MPDFFKKMYRADARAGNQSVAQIGYKIWGCSSVGRAPALQAGGQEFESLHLHLRELKEECA